MRRTALPHALLGLMLAASGAVHGAEPAVGDTRIARWKDDRAGVFLLMFDDSWPSHWQVAAPELAKRGLTGTFYINPGKGEYRKFADEWERKVWAMGMAYGCHTMTHQGAGSVEEADREIGNCTREILRIVPGPNPRLLSWGMPGVKVWTPTTNETAALLAKHHLIDRPPFTGHGAVYHLKTLAEMLDLADRAVRTRAMEYLVIHGVERIAPNWNYQDFWALKQDIFLPLLDALKARSDRGELWVTDHISQHVYEVERDTASARTAEAGDARIVVTLACTADAAFYHAPLTLVTRVPGGWQRCRVIQGNRTNSVAVAGGEARYDATPGPAAVELTPIRGDAP